MLQTELLDMGLQTETQGGLTGSELLERIQFVWSVLSRSRFEDAFHPTNADGSELADRTAVTQLRCALEDTTFWRTDDNHYKKDAAGKLRAVVLCAENQSGQEFCMPDSAPFKVRGVLNKFFACDHTAPEIRIVVDPKKKIRVVRGSSVSSSEGSENRVPPRGFRVLTSINPLNSSDEEHARVLATLLFTAIEEENFQADPNNFASHLDLETRQEVVSTVRSLAKQIPIALPESASDAPVNSVVAIHIAPLHEAGDPAIARKMTDIARMKFEEYVDALRCKDEPQPPIILVSSSAYDLLRCRFTFEPVGEQSGSQVYRLWAEMQSPAPEFSSEETDALDEGDRIVDFPASGLNAEQAVQDRARSLLNLLNEDDEPGIVLHWQCTHDRHTDLLRPIDESLGHLLGMTFRTEFNAGDDHVSRPVDIKDTVGRFLDQWVGAEDRKQHSPVLLALLAGGDDRDGFKNVVSAISALLKNLALSKKVRVVLEAATKPDELVETLVEFLRKGLPSNATFQLFRVRSDNQSSSDNNSPTIRKWPTGDTNLLLQIAAVLGTDFQLAWLKSCFMAIAVPNGGEDQIRFNRALDEALRDGYLQFCDSLITEILDSRNPETQYHSVRQVKWVNRADHRLSNVEFQHQVVSAFWDSLSSATSPELPKVSSLRLKARTFDILNSSIEVAENQQIVDSMFMAELALFLGHRARVAGAPVEARSRLHQGIEWWKLGTEEQRESNANIGRDLAQNSLDLWSDDRFRAQAEDDPGFALADECLSAIPSTDLRDADLASVWFPLARSAWSIQNWSGPLSKAELHAKTMSSIADCIQGGTQLEAWHALSVTQFAQGNLEDCESNARNGVEYCRNTASFGSGDEHVFGSHDGRACCKALAGLCDIIKTGEDTDELVKEAVVFASRHGNEETYRVACGYKAMSELILGRFSDAMATCNAPERFRTSQSSKDCPTSQRWSVFTNLLRVCAAIAERVMRGAALGGNDLSMTISSLRNDWKVREYDSLWLTFEALAIWIDHQGTNACDAKFNEAVEIATKRRETVFMPLTYLWWARVDLRSEKFVEAQQHISCGLERARDFGSALWTQQLKSETAVRT